MHGNKIKSLSLLLVFNNSELVLTNKQLKSTQYLANVDLPAYDHSKEYLNILRRQENKYGLKFLETGISACMYLSKLLQGNMIDYGLFLLFSALPVRWCGL
jgi:hypothetical protein